MRVWPKNRGIEYYRDAFFPSKYFRKIKNSSNIPTFMFHCIDPVGFEKQLSFLKRNNYQVITCEESDNISNTEKLIRLTFDDGRHSVWTVAYPLLKKYGFKATAFISPGIMREGEKRLTYCDNGFNPSSEDPFGNYKLFNWGEAKEMHETGVIDMQLHGFAHSRIFVSDEIIDFAVTNGADRNKGISYWQIRENDIDNFLEELELGQPVYRFGSRWGKDFRYFDDQSLRFFCINYVRNNGGYKFVSNPNWKDILYKKVNEYISNNKLSVKVESQIEKQADLIELLTKSKNIIYEKLGKNAQHFAVPWASGDPEMTDYVVKEVGVSNIHWEHIDRDSDCARKDSGVKYHARLKDIFIRRLEGKGRQSIVSFLLSEYLNIKKDMKKINS